MRFMSILHVVPALFWVQASAVERLVHRDFDAPAGKESVAGPRPPLYPGFNPDNQAIEFSGPGRVLVIPDRPELRMDQGDSLTLEAWVRLDEIADDQNMYILGKGRTHNPGFPHENQNYAMRLRGTGAKACLSFLFRSRPDGEWKGDWHRWTTEEGIHPGSGWHTLALCYSFGTPDSISAWIDGEKRSGYWDMGGKTKRSPVVDADEIWIGGSMGKKGGSQFQGAIDEVAISRGLIQPETLASRYKINLDALPPPRVVDIPDGQVLVELFEKGVPSSNTWPIRELEPSLSYPETAFGFFRYPQKYIGTGVREDRGNPLLLRAYARLRLPAGEHRLLIRGRSATRLFVDDQKVGELKFRSGFKDGHNPIRTDYLDLGPEVRWAAPGCKEEESTWLSDGKEHLFRFETMVGGGSKGRQFRPELGETLVAVAAQGGAPYTLLSPREQIPLTDAGWLAFQAEREGYYDAMDRQGRARAFANHEERWAKRHEAARNFVEALKPVALPNPSVDAFIERKFVVRGGVDRDPKQRFFVDRVHPLLKEHCFRCHGKKEKGGLKLDVRARALKGGESGHPAIVPGEVGNSLLIEMVKSSDDEEWMPPKGERLDAASIAVLEKWITDGAEWARVDVEPVKPARLIDDLAYLRRATLDTVGVVPTRQEIDQYLSLSMDVRRRHAVDRLLEDPRWADHWTGYWQDVLAENPSLVKPSLNNTGPFRWWIYESFLDNKPMDIFVHELVSMKGSTYAGGPAGFKLATQNDVPMAAKANILGGAFMGVQMKCARCHDAPYHEVKQRQVFSLAAMLERKALAVPKSSSVPVDTFHGRKPLIQVTMKPGEKADPVWLFDELVSKEASREADSRERLADLLTAPQNRRFSQVTVNRVWKRYMGRGIVEPVDDWEHAENSHPELLDWLAREFVRKGYDLKHVARLILTSRAYQRSVDPDAGSPESFAGAQRRRLEAEQVVDSLHQVVGLPMHTEPLTMDLDNTNSSKNFVHLGTARRGWMFTSLSNERDRPSLALPRAQAVVDVLTAFGWRPSRQEPLTDRGSETNVIQPAIIANGVMGNWLTRLSDQHELTQLCLVKQPLDQLIDALFLRMLTRHPTALELQRFTRLLQEGYGERIVRDAAIHRPEHCMPRYVTWSNHLNPQANEVAIEQEKEARAAYPSTHRLREDWRDRMEDMVWTLVNSPEMVYYP
jgi:hypothetical protein